MPEKICRARPLVTREKQLLHNSGKVADNYVKLGLHVLKLSCI